MLGHRSALRAYYRALPVDPTAGIRLPRPRPQPKRPFTADERARILAACRTERERLIVLILMATGIRVSELSGLRREDIGEEGYALIHGKGGRERYVYLPDRVRAAIDGRQGHILTCDEPRTPARYRGLPVSTHTIWEIVQRIGARAGVHAHPHRFRTDYANRFLAAGGDLGALQVVLGHSDVQQTLHYASWGTAERAMVQQRTLALAD